MITNDKATFTSYRVGIAAEAAAASILCQAGYDVSVQYGANQPLYDLVAVKPNRVLQVSVKGSKDGGWGLSGSYKRGRSYAAAAEHWLGRHGDDLLFMFVQYKGVALGDMPRFYVARAREVCDHLKQAHLGRGDTILFEDYHWRGGTAKGHIDKIPDEWKLSQGRLDAV